MKMFLIVCCGLLLHAGALAQQYLPIDENNLILGRPANANFVNVDPATLASALEAFKALKVEYRYINGSCEDRAHLLVAFLRSKNIAADKIWNFAPAKYTLVSTQLFKAADPLGVQTEILWGYHVAPVVVSGADTLIIDYSFSTAPLKRKEWLSKMNCRTSLYTFTDARAYLFNTMNGLTVYDNSKNPAPPGTRLPDFLPSVISGDFWSYSTNLGYIEQGLAINDLAVYAAENFKQHADYSKIIRVLSNIDDLEKFALNNQQFQIGATPAQQLRTYYNNRITFWRNEIQKLTPHMP